MAVRATIHPVNPDSQASIAPVVHFADGVLGAGTHTERMSRRAAWIAVASVAAMLWGARSWMRRRVLPAARWRAAPWPAGSRAAATRNWPSSDRTGQPFAARADA